MSNVETHQNPRTDPMDQLLADAFERSLTSPDNPAILEGVMTRIARQEQLRMLVVGLIGILAALLAGLAALPLIGMLEPLLNGLFSTVTHAAAGPLPEDAADLPALALLLGLAIAAGWLFLEEAL